MIRASSFAALVSLALIGRLAPAGGAQPQAPRHAPGGTAGTARADKTRGPAERAELAPTGRVLGKPPLEFHQRARIILGHGPGHYGLGQVESSKYP